MEDMNISTTVDEIIGIGKKCAMFGVKEAVIYSIFAMRQFKLTKVIHQINDLLKDKFKENNFLFVCSDNVTR